MFKKIPLIKKGLLTAVYFDVLRLYILIRQKSAKEFKQNLKEIK